MTYPLELSRKTLRKIERCALRENMTPHDFIVSYIESALENHDGEIALETELPKAIEFVKSYGFKAIKEKTT